MQLLSLSNDRSSRPLPPSRTRIGLVFCIDVICLFFIECVDSVILLYLLTILCRSLERGALRTMCAS